MQRKDIHSYQEAVEYLLGIPKFTSKHSLEETRKFLEVLGNPDRGLRILHVAGTNGKGSVCAYMRSILEAAGLRVAVFTSPHLVDIRERFYLEGRQPSRQEFLEAFLKVYDRLDWDALEKEEGYHPTFFEYLFFMAMVMFAENMPDFCILETGLGGRLDATNSVGEKALTVITRIGLDHTEYLGSTLDAIAGEKAGILRRGTALVYADVVPEATEVFEKQARELQIPTFPVSKRDYTILKIKNKTIDFLGQYRYHKDIRFSLSTSALYQVENAALALKAVEVLEEEGKLSQVLGEPLTPRILQEGLKRCFWAGRMEEVLPEVFVDGAHNPDGIRAFLETVEADGCQGRRKLFFGVVADKDYRSMLEEILESHLFQEIHIVHLRSGRAASLEAIKAVLDSYPDLRCSFYKDLETAFQDLLKGQGECRVYLAGSLYLVGEVKELLERKGIRGLQTDNG